jgi:hypothetical protein
MLGEVALILKVIKALSSTNKKKGLSKEKCKKQGKRNRKEQTNNKRKSKKMHNRIKVFILEKQRILIQKVVLL